MSDGSGWTGAVTNTSSQTVTVSIYAICTDAPAGFASAARINRSDGLSLAKLAQSTRRPVGPPGRVRPHS